MKKLISVLLSIIVILGTVSTSLVCVAGSLTLVWPVPANTTKLTQGYHSGCAIDIADSSSGNAIIVSATSGKVTNVFKCTQQHNGSSMGSNGVKCDGFGTGVVIKGPDGRFYGYAHMKANSIPSNIYVGATVSAGQEIGKIGSTGNSSGNHLHFQITTGTYYNKNSNINPRNETYTYNTTHTHDFSVFLWCWKAHPHYNEYQCKYCSATEVNKNETNYLASCETCNHAHSYSVTATYSATCTTDGYYVYTCSCGHSYTSTYQYALGHDFSSYDYTESAHPHYNVYKCSRSGCNETSRSTQTSPDSDCSLCNPAPPAATDVTVTTGNSNTSTEIKWNARNVAASDVDQADYFTVRIYRQQNGSYSLYSTEKVTYSLSKLNPSLSINLPAGSYYTEIVTVCGENESLTSCTDKYYFTVKEQVATYTVSYNANGGSGAPASQTKNHGSSLTLSSSVPTKKYTITYNANGGSVSPASKTLNCKFMNWNTSQNGKGTSYKAGATYSANSNVTLYAQYATPTAGTLATPTRSGYKFDGWYTAASGGTKITTSTVISKNTTVYAHWTSTSQPTTKPSTPTTKPTVPATKPSTPATKPSIVTTVTIRIPSTTSIAYGDSIILHADVKNLPSGAKVVWTADNSNFTFAASSDGTICTVSPSANGNTTFTATVVDANGKEISSDSQTMTSNAGIFQKIIAFFKKLFGMTKVIPEMIKTNF
ncbi:MAG: InlB B-repeat-containing protein [Clostridia bacterium]|nr:InlB B-repeat-containing protein [Clostridia bacterium]